MSITDRKVKRFRETMGNSWWWRRYADLVDRRQSDGSYRPFDYNEASKVLNTPKNWARYKFQIENELPIERKQPTRIAKPGATRPEMLARPEGMTRQQHRRLFREACKLEGVPWRRERTFKTPRKERGRNWKDLSPEQVAELEAQWAKFMEESLTIK